MANTGYGFGTIAAAGSAAFSTTPLTLRGVIAAATYVGTVQFYDATSAGTTAANLMLTVGTSNAPFELHPDMSFRKGLSWYATGTPVLVFTVE